MSTDGAAKKRADAKKARRERPVPEKSEQYAQLDIEQLRQRRAELNNYEIHVSYWRRILQTRLDLLAAGRDMSNLDSLTHMLTDAPGAGRRMVKLDILPPGQPPELPGMEELWRYTPTGEEDTKKHVEKLAEAEQKLSKHRRELHQQIDSLQDELIARYRENPRLALDVLPGRGSADE